MGLQARVSGEPVAEEGEGSDSRHDFKRQRWWQSECGKGGGSGRKAQHPSNPYLSH